MDSVNIHDASLAHLLMLNIILPTFFVFFFHSSSPSLKNIPVLLDSLYAFELCGRARCPALPGSRGPLPVPPHSGGASALIIFRH